MQRSHYIVAALLGAAIVVAYAVTAKAHAGPWTGCAIGVAGSQNTATVEDTLGADGLGIAGSLSCDLERNGFLVGAWGEYGVRKFDWSPASIDVDAEGWAVGGRAGYLVLPAALLYVSVGYTDLEADILGASLDVTGPIVGGGVEVGFGGGFYGGVEYQRLMLEVDGANLDAAVDSFRGVLKYKFGASDPIIPAFDAPAAKPAPLK